MPPGDRLAERAEHHDTDVDMYHGPVMPYAIGNGGAQADDDLYNAVAQVWQKNNLREGLPRLAALIAAGQPARAEFYLLEADAWRDSGQIAKAVPLYEEAVRRNGTWLYAQRKLGLVLDESGQGVRAVEMLRRATVTSPRNAEVWHEYGQLLLHQNRGAEAAAALRQALALDPEIAEAHNSLGLLAAQGQDMVRAEAAFREAVRISPDNVEAVTNLAHTLSWKEPPDIPMATWYFERALRMHTGYAPAQFGYADLLNTQGQYGAAQPHAEAALAVDPNFAEAHELMGNLWERQGRFAQALDEYRAAVRINPQFFQAQLYLGDLLVRTGDAAGAIEHLRIAAKSPDPVIRDLAMKKLK